MPKPRPAKPIQPVRPIAVPNRPRGRVTAAAGSKTVAAPKRPPRRLPWRGLMHVVIGAGLVAGVGYAARAARLYVEQAEAIDAPRLTVELVGRPTWMSDFLTRQIAATLPREPASPFDHAVLETAAARLAANPWVASVRQVRRAYGQSPGDTLVVDCTYRAPAALVRWGRSYWMVDNGGVKLPESFPAADVERVTVGRDGRTAMRTVAGVASPPPPAGQRWPGADLSAGLDMVKLAYGKPYLDGVAGVDVTNYAGRIDRGRPRLVLTTRQGTQVWWGRPPLTDDDYVVEVPVARKLATLAAVVKRFGRVDGGKAWIDVRFDTPLLPADPPIQGEGAKN